MTQKKFRAWDKDAKYQIDKDCVCYKAIAEKDLKFYGEYAKINSFERE